MHTLCRCDRALRTRPVFAGLLAALLLLLSISAFPQTESRSQKYEFDIPRATRVQALHELSRQADELLLGYLSNDTAEEQQLVGPIKGRYTVDDALRMIMHGSLLTFRWVEGNMVSVEPLPVARGSRELDEQAKTLPHSTDPDRALSQLREEITVISWPLRDFTFAVAPAVVVDRDRIEAIGAPTLAEALRYISQSAYTRPEGYRASGAQYAEMRGLGPDTALVLINGRRTLPSANSLSSSAFDLNTVPITAVERVEFLLDSAAAAYGADAIGGVINIVLREKVPEPTVELRYGEASGGAEQRRFTFSGGLNRETVHAALVFDYFELDGLLGAERDRWRNQDFRRFGGADRRSLISSPGNITAATGGNLPGLPSSFASVPLEDASPGVSREDFLATAGQRSLDSQLQYSTVVPEATRLSTTATASVDLPGSITASAELLYVDRDATYYFSPPVLPGLPVVTSNAFNPFGIAVLAHRLLTEYDSQYQYVESDLVRTVGVLHGGLGSWDWELAAVHSNERASTWTHNVLDMRAVLNALASPDTEQALNPFQNAAIGSPELLAALLAPRDVSEFASKGTQLSGYLQGPIWSLPAGPLSAVIGGEWRNEAALFDNPQGSFDRDRDVTAGFAQLRVPVVGESMRWPGIKELLLTAGTRVDRYSDVDRIERSQVGLLWKPHRYFTVRASGGSSFRPPSLHELHFPKTSTLATVSDPARNDELADNITITVGGNTQLRPTTARSLTTGIVFSPDTALNWKISADYWRVTMKERVISLPLPLLLANEDQFASHVVRAERTDADVQAGLPGALRSIDTSRINTGGVRTSGVDLAIKADVQTELGRFTPELLATWFDEFSSADIPGRPALDRVDLASDLGTILQWRAILSLSWKRGPYGATVFARHTPSYDDSIAGERTGREVAAQTLFDLHGSLDLGGLLAAPLWDGCKVTLGGTNIFDEEPSFAEVGGASGFDMSHSDLKQRSYYLRLDKTF
jgi:iron complex outermembrane recepter protein